MKTLLSTSLRPCCPGHCRGSCCFLGIHYLTVERAAAKDKSQQDVPGGVTGTLSESEKRSRSRFSQCREHVCCSVTRPLGLVPGSLLGSFQKWGYLAARYLWLNPTYAGGSPSKTQKGSQVGLQGSPSLSGFLPSALPSLMPPHRLRCTP